jgi:hypothetical protein
MNTEHGPAELPPDPAGPPPPKSHRRARAVPVPVFARLLPDSTGPLLAGAAAAFLLLAVAASLLIWHNLSGRSSPLALPSPTSTSAPASGSVSASTEPAAGQAVVPLPPEEAAPPAPVTTTDATTAPGSATAQAELPVTGRQAGGAASVGAALVLLGWGLLHLAGHRVGYQAGYQAGKEAGNQAGPGGAHRPAAWIGPYAPAGGRGAHRRRAPRRRR